ncbi:MAG: DNA-binding response regulator [Chitinophagaceae bacterium]
MTKATDTIKVVLADDHELFRDGFKTLLRKRKDIKFIGEAKNGLELANITSELKPDVVITDIKMPIMDGIEATKEITKKNQSVGIIALSMFNEDNLVVEMMELGAKGYLLKNAPKDEIISAIKTVYKGNHYFCSDTSLKLAHLLGLGNFDVARKNAEVVEFSEREKTIIRLICEGNSNKEIASKIFLSVRTVETHRDRIQEKMQVKNAAGVVVYAIKHKLYSI